MRITHIGGPTAIIEVGGWRLLTDPTFDSPGERYVFALGLSSRKLAGPAPAADAVGPIDAVLLSHDHHDDNLDPAGRALLPGAGVVRRRRPARSGSAAMPIALQSWQSHTLSDAGIGRQSTITATPAATASPGVAHRRGGDRLLADLGRPGAWRGVDLRRHRVVRRRA